MVKLKTNLPKIKKKDAKVSKASKVKNTSGKKNKAPKPTRKKVTKKSSTKVTSASIAINLMKDVKTATSSGKKMAAFKVDSAVANSVVSYLSVTATNILVKEYSVTALRGHLTSNLDSTLKAVATKALSNNSAIYADIQTLMAEKVKGKVAAIINKTQRGVTKEPISVGDLKVAVADIQAVISPVAAPKKKPVAKKATTKKKPVAKKKTKRSKRGK